MSHPVLLVGLGQIGIGYDSVNGDPTDALTHARAFAQHDDFDLCGGVDPESERRQLFKERYGSQSFESVTHALQILEPSVVVIATPTHDHETTLNAVLDKMSPQAILMEKPLAYDLESARRMVSRCRDAGVALFANYMRRADPAALEVRRRILAGEIAGPIKGVAWYSKGFLHNGSHFFNLLEFWLGPMVHSRVIDAGRACQDGDAEPDARVVFENGSVVFLAAREEAFSHYTIELIASNGRLRYDDGGSRVEWQPTAADNQFAGYTVLATQLERLPADMSRYQWHVAEQLARALKGQSTTLCSGADALATLVSMKAVMES